MSKKMKNTFIYFCKYVFFFFLKMPIFNRQRINIIRCCQQFISQRNKQKKKLTSTNLHSVDEIKNYSRLFGASPFLVISKSQSDPFVRDCSFSFTQKLRFRRYWDTKVLSSRLGDPVSSFMSMRLAIP